MKSLDFGKSPKLNDRLFRPGTVISSKACLALLAPLDGPDYYVSKLEE